MPESQAVAKKHIDQFGHQVSIKRYDQGTYVERDVSSFNVVFGYHDTAEVVDKDVLKLSFEVADDLEHPASLLLTLKQITPFLKVVLNQIDVNQ